MSDASLAHSWSLAALAGGAGVFRADDRFTAKPNASTPPPQISNDPLAEAWDQGHAAGFAEAQAAALEVAQREAKARSALALSFTRLDAALEEQLRLRLRETVTALCEAAIAPLALDQDGLLRRITKAVSMLARADDHRVIRLHPDDLALIAPRLAAEWTVEPDPALERGALRLECASGGVEDGPDQWRIALAQALAGC